MNRLIGLCQVAISAALLVAVNGIVVTLARMATPAQAGLMVIVMTLADLWIFERRT